MSELDDAIRLANKVLDDHNRDPDGDLSMLARQFRRAREAIESLEARIGGLTISNEQFRRVIFGKDEPQMAGTLGMSERVKMVRAEKRAEAAESALTRYKAVAEAQAVILRLVKDVGVPVIAKAHPGNGVMWQQLMAAAFKEVDAALASLPTADTAKGGE